MMQTWPRLRELLGGSLAGAPLRAILERSIAGERRVFHDVKVVEFEIDHVLISSAGIFVIAVLPAMPASRDLMCASTEHARELARYLNSLLKERSGGWNRVSAIMLVPGYSAAPDDVLTPGIRVMTPNELPAFVNALPALLDQTDICQLSCAMSDIVRDAKRLTRHLERTGQSLA
jgi:hypothetical protein